MDQDDLKQAQLEMCKLLELPTSILKEEESDQEYYSEEGGESEMSEPAKEIINLNIPSEVQCKFHSSKSINDNPEDFN